MSNPSSNSFGKLKHWFYVVLEFFGAQFVSKHGRRVMFIASLYAQITQLERMKAEVVAKLNAVMGSKFTREAAAEFPAAVSDIVWRGTDVGSLITQELSTGNVDEQRAQALSARIVSISPSWLRYGSREMEADVRQLLMTSYPELQHAA
jgi:hypothetical protein